MIKEKYSDLKMLNLKKAKDIYSIEEIKVKLEAIFEKYCIEQAYVFGSYARGTATKDSDVDIIISGGEFNDFEEYLEFTCEIISELRKEVDIIREENYLKKSDNEYFNLANEMFFSLIKTERRKIYG